MIRIADNQQHIRREGNTLIIDGANLKEATLHFLDALDQKYFYAGTLPTTGSDGAALKKAGLAGKTLK
jgi:hypothetical protein